MVRKQWALVCGLFLLAITALLGCASQPVVETCQSSYWNMKTQNLVSICEKEANAGNRSSMMVLSSIYFQGIGMSVDYEKSAMWMKKASDMGYCDAQVKYATYLIKGLGVKKDVKEGIQLFLRTMESGCKQPHNYLEALSQGVIKENQKRSKVQRIHPDSFKYFATVEKQADWHPNLYKLSLTIHQSGPVQADPDVSEYAKHFYFLYSLSERTMERKFLKEPYNAFSWSFFMVPKTDRIYFPELNYAGNFLKPRFQ